MLTLKNMILCAGICLALIQSASAATIIARTDRNPINLDETVQLVFEANTSVDADPDFSALEQDFEILNRGQSSNISMINGAITRSTQWTLTLMPKKAGTLTIPSIPFGQDTSPQLRLTVKASADNKQGQGSGFFTEIEASTSSTWVQGQIVLTQRLYSNSNISRYELGEIKINSVDAIIEPLGDEKQYQTRINNQPHLVIERRFAVFPQQSGQLIIEPVLSGASIVEQNNRFDPFGRNTSVRRARSKELKIEVTAIPTSFSGNTWLPASEIKLIDEWPSQNPKFKVGEPVTRTLTLMADGLTSAQLPEISSPQVAGLKQYPDQPTLHDRKNDDGIIGIRQEKIAFIPTRAGSYTLPAIEIKWWNTKTQKMAVAHTPSRTITVAAGSLPNPTPAPVVGDDSQPSAETTATSPEVTIESPGFWPWLSLFLAVGWLLSMLLWWWLSRAKSAVAKSPDHSSQVNTRQAIKAVKTACKQQDAKACKDALLTWGQAVFPHSPPTSLAALAQCTGEPLATSLLQLNTALYSPTVTDWDSDELLKQVFEFNNEILHRPSQDYGQLEPLYK